MDKIIMRQLDVLAFEKEVLGVAINNPKEIATMSACGLSPAIFRTDNAKQLWTWLSNRVKIGSDTNFPETSPPVEMGFYRDCLTACVSMNAEVMAKGLVALNKREKICNQINMLSKQIAETPPFAAENYRESVVNLLMSIISNDESIITKSPEQNHNELVSELDDRIKNQKAKQIISTGIKKLDDTLGGFIGGRLYVLAARTGQGKTTLAINMADSAALSVPVAYFTVEMQRGEILEKIISKRTNINSRKIDSGDINAQDADKIFSALSDVRPIYINHEFRASFESLELEIRRLVSLNSIRVVFVDYIQQLKILNFKSPNRHQEITEISSRLKSLAMQLDICIIVIAQLNREASDELPKLNHIKDSGAIEQDADAVIFIHHVRDDFTIEESWIYIEKNRRGPTGGFRIKVDLPINLFENATDDRMV